MTALKLWGGDERGGASRAGAVRFFLGLLLTALSIPLLSQCSPRPSKEAITIVLSVNPDSGLPPLEVAFDASRSSASDGSSLTFTWELGNGELYVGPVLVKGFEDPGDYVVKLRVTSERGATATAQRKVRVLRAHASSQDVFLTPGNPRQETVGGLIIALADTAHTKLKVRVSYSTPDKHPPASPFQLLGVWRLFCEDSIDGEMASDHPLLYLSFPVRPGVSDALVVEWAGDFWFPARNEDGAPGGSLDAQGMFVRLGRRDLSFFSIARWKREVLELLSNLPEFPPQPEIKVKASTPDVGRIMYMVDFFQPHAVTYKLHGLTIGIGGVWNCIELEGLTAGVEATWSHPPAFPFTAPLLSPGVKQWARLTLPGGDGAVSVCLRPYCSAAFGRAALDWINRLGLPIEYVGEVVGIVEKLLTLPGKIVREPSWEESRADILRLVVTELAGLALKYIFKKVNPAVFVLNAVPVAADVAAVVVRCVQSRLGSVQDKCEVLPGTVPKITTVALPVGTLGVSYSGQLQAEGGRGPYSWEILSGNLPPGISLDGASGALSGKPMREGEWQFLVRVSDKHELRDERQFLLSVVSSGPPLPLPSAAPASIEGEYVLYLSAEESVGETVLRLDKGGRFTVVVRSGGMTLTWASGAYTAKYTDATKREGIITFEVIPGILTVEGKLFPNAIVASLMLTYPTEVWFRRGAKMVSEGNVYGSYRSEDGKSGITITRGVGGNLLLVLEWRTGRRCTYESVMSDRSINISALKGGGLECDVWPVNRIVVIDENWICTYSLMFQEWTGVWKKVLPGG